MKKVMRLKCLAYCLLGTLVSIHAKSKPWHLGQDHIKRSNIKIGRYNKTQSHVDLGTKRTWDCHRGCLRFCLPSCKKSCCQLGAKDFSISMIKEIEQFHGELKGGYEQRNAINEGREVVEPFACGQFCSPECSPSCTIACCTDAFPKVAEKLVKNETSLPLQQNSLTKISKMVQSDPQKSLDRSCSQYCSASCKPDCSSECCNSQGGRKQSSMLMKESFVKPLQTHLLFTLSGTCHNDCEKLCLPACEFVCCVPVKMRSEPFIKGFEMQNGRRAGITR